MLKISLVGVFMLNDSLNLYYSSPAKEWVEALPLGNGSIGAMVFGKTNTEKICMNSDTLWTGFPRETRIKENTYENFLKARELSLKGKYDEAQDIIEEECLGNWTQSYLPLCDINIKFDTKGCRAKEYKRILDLSTGIHTITYEKNGVQFKREAFVSNPDNDFIQKYSAVRYLYALGESKKLFVKSKTLADEERLRFLILKLRLSLNLFFVLFVVTAPIGISRIISGFCLCINSLLKKRKKASAF